ncbi:MAG: ATP-dependent helicase [Chitinispirillaceae bacterium]|nr:ATP-dependent helicase [Chitinispirillaceae bacterium]
MSTKSFLEELNTQQRDAVTSENGPVLVVAGAGSGKTKTLAYRVAYLISRGVPAERILLLTFTRRAAKEMLSRAVQVLSSENFISNQVWSGTFHSVANRLLRIYGKSLGLEPEFTIIDPADAEDMLDVIRQKKIDVAKTGRFPKKSTLLSIYTRRMNAGEELELILKRDFSWCEKWKDELKIIFREYTAQKQTRNVLDYDDLLQYWFYLLQDKTAASIIDKKFDHVLVDEYQDLNNLQADILKLMRQQNRNIMAVGDDAQSIYSFRAASVRNMLDFPSVYPQTRIIMLEQNYRSDAPILETTNTLIASARNRFSKQLFTSKHGGELPQLITCNDEDHEADEVIGRVLKHYEQGVALHEQAVLFRAASHSATLEIALMKRDIPFIKYGGLRFLEAAHVKDFIAFVRTVENIKDEPAWFRILKLFKGVGPAKAAAIFEHLANNQFSLDSLATAPVDKKVHFELLNLRKLHLDLRNGSGLECAVQLERVGRFYQPLLQENYDNADPRKNDIEHIIEMSSQYQTRSQFLSELMLDPPSSTSDLAGASKKDEDHLVLSTIHSAKGCEWDAVYVIHAADGCIPSDMATHNDESIDEELRLMYVAMTRARKNLYVLWPMRFFSRPQGFSDRHIYSQCSRFFKKDVCATMKCIAGDDSSVVIDNPEEMTGARIDIKTRLKDFWD